MPYLKHKEIVAAAVKRPYFGLWLCAGAGLVLGNFLLGEESARLASYLSSRFGSAWFFDDLLAGSLSPMGALLGAVLGFALLDLPYLCYRQLRRDRLHDAFQRLKHDQALQLALCTAAGGMAAASPKLTLAQRQTLQLMLIRAGLSLDETTEPFYIKAFFLGVQAPAQVKAALLRIKALRSVKERQALERWLAARFIDFALSDLELSYQEEARFYELTRDFELMRADLESMLHLRLSAAAEYRPSVKARALAAAPWIEDQPAEGGSEESAESLKRYTAAPFDEEAALAAAEQAAAQGRDLTLAEAYTVLGLPYGAPAAAVKKRYRQLMFKYHPDHASGSSPAARQRAAVLSVQLRLAAELILKS